MRVYHSDTHLGLVCGHGLVRQFELHETVHAAECDVLVISRHILHRQTRYEI